MLKSLAGKTKIKILSSLKQTSVEAASVGRVEIKNSDWAVGMGLFVILASWELTRKMAKACVD